jgi:hypothetical protein
LSVKISEVKREYQLQEWSGMLRERKESGLSVKAWCSERGITEHAYYYRLRQLRQMACNALEQAQPAQLAEVPLAPKVSENQAVLRLTTSAGTLEIINADRSVLDQVLRTMLYAE